MMAYLSCGTPYCSGETYWCYRCKLVTSNCDCGFCFSTCHCDNPKNWLAVGEHKSLEITKCQRAADGATTTHETTQHESRLAELKRIGFYPPSPDSCELDPMREVLQP